MSRAEASRLAGRHLLMVGVSHTQASVELRERLHIDLRVAREICLRLARDDGEAVVVSTCNRTEIYLATDDVIEARARAFDELASLTDLDGQRLRSVLSVLSDHGAAAHLFAVAGGLESLVVGETEILGQVREAHRAALEVGASGPVLNRLFQQAVET
jgi:glutamyl-tRNA reductase